MRLLAAAVAAACLLAMENGVFAQSLSETGVRTALICPAGTAENDSGNCQAVAGAVVVPETSDRCGPLADGSYGVKGPDGGCEKILDPRAGINLEIRKPTLNLLLTFNTNSAVLTPEGEANARVFARALKGPELHRARIQIDGYTDAAGSRTYNLELSQRRANAVKAFLASQGVESDRLITRGYGSDNLADPNRPVSEANRRVLASRVIQ